MKNTGLSSDITLDDLYIIDSQVSDGVHGRVLRGFDRESPKKHVAVKEIFLPPGDMKEILTRFEAEAGLLSTIDCEGFPKVQRSIMENDSAYLISDWVEGENLEEILRRNRGPLPVFDVLSLMLETAAILKVLHSDKYKIIHGDIKPINLKVPYPGKIALVDMGSQEILKRYPPENYVVPHTFSAPEAFQGKPEFRSDIYSLFAVGHYLLSGINPVNFPPFSFPPIQDLNPNVNDQVGDFFRKGFSYFPDYRHKNIAEMINDIEICLRLVSTESIYADRFNCPKCNSVLSRGLRICADCSLDFGIYDGTDSPDNYIRRGKDFLDSGKITRADRCFYQAARLGRESAELFTLIAKCRFLSGETELAQGMLKNLIEKYPSSSLPCLELVRIYRKMGMIQEAEDMLAFLKAKHSGDISYLLFIAEDFMNDNDYKKAYSSVEEILKENPHNREALELKGKIIKKSGNRSLLAEYLLEHEELARNGRMELELALYYKGKEDFSNAFQCMARTVSKNSDDPALRTRTAFALRDMQMIGFACKTMVETLSLVGDEPEYFRKAVLLLMEEGKFADVLPFLHYIYTKYKDSDKNGDFVSGVLKLLKSVKPKDSCEQVKNLVEKYCRLLRGDKEEDKGENSHGN